MPPEAKVFIVEDSGLWAEDYRMILPEGGHSVIGIAGNMNEATSALDQMQKGDFDVAIVDGNLAPGKHDGEEGNLLIKKIKTKFPEVKIFGISGLPEDFVGADATMSKAEFDPDLINQTITNF